MKKVKRFLMVMGILGCIGSMQAQQIQGDFDQVWVNCNPYTGGDTKTTGKQPVGWVISNIAGYKLFGSTWLGATEVASSVAGRDGTGYAVNMVNSPNSVAKSQMVPAYLTLGTSWNTADTSGNNADGGTFGGISFTNRPDAVHFYYKRSAADATQSASAIAYLWSGTFKQANVPVNVATASKLTYITMVDRDRNILGMTTDKGGDVTDESGKLIASLEYYITETNPDEWKELTINFDYKDLSTVPQKLNIVFSANNYFAAKSDVKKDNRLIIDDVTLVYNSQLSALTYDGTTIPNFAINNFSTLDMSAIGYDASKLAYTSNGVGAIVEPVFDNVTGLLTITVKGDDILVNAENKHVYKVQFATPPVDVTPIVGAYPSALSVNAFGNLSPIISQNISLIKGSDEGVINLSISDFKFGTIPVGDINMVNIPVSLKNGVYTLKRNTQNVFLQGLGIELPVELLAASINSQNQLAASLSIALGEDIVTVEVYPFTVEGTTDIKVAGHVSKAASQVLLVDTESVYTSLDLSAATIDADVTYADLSTNLTQSENLLIYVPANSTITGTNVVVGTKASSIVLTDKVPFSAPKAFTADVITYTRNCYTDGGWETIALPFAVSNVSGEYKLEKFKNSDDTKVNFETATAWEANTAYLFSLKGDGTNVDCTFTGSGSIEPATWTGKFCGVYEKTDAVGKYLMGQDGKSFVLGVTEGSNSAYVEPFRAYLDETAVPNKAPSYTIGHDGGATGVVAPEVINTIYVSGSTIIVNSNEAMTINVYDVVGKLVRKVALNEGENTIGGLPSGFYVVNGQKVVIK